MPRLNRSTRRALTITCPAQTVHGTYTISNEVRLRAPGVKSGGCPQRLRVARSPAPRRVNGLRPPERGRCARRRAAAGRHAVCMGAAARDAAEGGGSTHILDMVRGVRARISLLHAQDADAGASRRSPARGCRRNHNLDLARVHGQIITTRHPAPRASIAACAPRASPSAAAASLSMGDGGPPVGTAAAWPRSAPTPAYP